MYKINQRMKILNSDFFSLIKIRIGSATSVPRGRDMGRAVATSGFCSVFFRLRSLVPVVNRHHRELEQLDWMKSGQLLHPSVYLKVYMYVYLCA